MKKLKKPMVMAGVALAASLGGCGESPLGPEAIETEEALMVRERAAMLEAEEIVRERMRAAAAAPQPLSRKAGPKKKTVWTDG